MSKRGGTPIIIAKKRLHHEGVGWFGESDEGGFEELLYAITQYD